jgi:hypothetical protein
MQYAAALNQGVSLGVVSYSEGEASTLELRTRLMVSFLTLAGSQPDHAFPETGGSCRARQVLGANITSGISPRLEQVLGYRLTPIWQVSPTDARP